MSLFEEDSIREKEEERVRKVMEEEWDDLRSRCKVLYVTPRMLMRLFLDNVTLENQVSVLSLEELKGFEDGIRVINAGFDSRNNCIYFTLAHKKWDVVPEGEEFPTLNGTVYVQPFKIVDKDTAVKI